MPNEYHNIQNCDCCQAITQEIYANLAKMLTQFMCQLENCLCNNLFCHQQHHFLDETKSNDAAMNFGGEAAGIANGFPLFVDHQTLTTEQPVLDKNSSPAPFNQNDDVDTSFCNSNNDHAVIGVKIEENENDDIILNYSFDALQAVNDNSSDELNSYQYFDDDSCQIGDMEESSSSCAAAVPLSAQLEMQHGGRNGGGGENSIQCDLCGKNFTRRNNLIIHMRIHTGEKPFQCPLCDKAFTDARYLRGHKRTHTGEKPYKCNLCDKAFTERRYLRYHRRMHSNNTAAAAEFECQFCGKSFASDRYLSCHSKECSAAATLIKKVQRSMKFNKSQSLVKFNADQRSITCSVCGQVFGDQLALYKHVQLHS